MNTDPTLFDAGSVAPDPTREHEAQWTPLILEAIAPLIPRGTRVHDPFAGTGVRAGRAADADGWIWSGTEIEPEFIVDQRVVAGDATDPSSYPTGDHVLLTSPPYPNGDSDHFKATNPVGRRPYRQALHRILGYDRPLHPNNLGRYNYRRGRKITAEYWRLAEATVSCWTADTVIVNMKDVYVDRKVVAVVDRWAELLVLHGYRITDTFKVLCPGNRYGANPDRVDHEVVLVGKRGTR